MALDLSALDETVLASPAAVARTTSETAPMAPLSDFEEDPNNPRTEFDGQKWPLFVEDIRERGILQPIIVIRTDAGKLRIRFGARRYRGAVEAGLDKAPYIVTEDPRQFDDYAQVAENEQREPLQPLELAAFIAKKLAAGEKKNRVAKNLRIDPSALTHLLALVDAPAFLLEVYHSGKCRLPYYLYRLRKLHEQNAEVAERRIAEADEVDRKLIDAIDAEINPPAIVLPAGPTDIRDVLDAAGSSGGGAGTGASGSPDRNSASGADATSADQDGKPNGPPTQQIPPHNPALEKQDAPTDDKGKLKKPLLLGTYNDRPVMVLLSHRPTAAGLALVRYEDGSGDEEVTIGEIALTLLSESKA